MVYGEKNVRQIIAWAVETLAAILLMIASFMALSDIMKQHNGDSFVVYLVILGFLLFALGSDFYDFIQRVRNK